MSITQLIDHQLIELDLAGDSKDAILQELVELIAENGALNDRHQFLSDLQKREQESSTGVGFEIAIPHGKSTGVDETKIAVGRNLSGVEWASLDGEPVQLVFLIAVPAEASGDEHLKILQQLSRKLMDDDFRNALKQAETKDNMLNTLSQID